jgi:hypothetical protein
MDLITRELDARTRPDFEHLARKQGGCWCTFYHRERPLRKERPNREVERINRRDKKSLVLEGRSHASLV